MNLTFSPRAWYEYTGWQLEDKKILKRINLLIKDIERNGNSGIGKSSILNTLFPDAEAETAEISLKLSRGKHTTRAVQSYDIGNDTVIIDTPGFSSFDVSMIEAIDPEGLAETFPDFAGCLGKCRFTDCRHINEPDCAVLEAVREGSIKPTRHASYVRLYEMLRQEQNQY